MVGAQFLDATQMVSMTGPSFYNWLTHTAELRRALNEPLQGLLFDLRYNDLWLPGWVARPASLSKGEAQLSRLAANAIPLIPVCGHRYLLGKPHQMNNPVISIHQSDLILYASNLRTYLLSEVARIPRIDVGLKPTDHDSAVALLDDDTFWGEIHRFNETS